MYVYIHTNMYTFTYAHTHIYLYIQRTAVSETGSLEVWVGTRVQEKGDDLRQGSA